MNEFLEFFKRLFGLSDEQVAKAELELNKAQKSETDTKETAVNQENAKEEKKNEEKPETTTKTGETEKNTKILKPTGVEDKSADATSIADKGDEKMSVTLEEYKKIQDELLAVKGILEKQTAEKAAADRMAKIKEFKDCLDFDYLSNLLDGVEEKDFASKVEEIKKDKGYLFKAPDTQGFNPATPQNQISGVEAKFYELNPSLRDQAL